MPSDAQSGRASSSAIHRRSSARKARNVGEALRALGRRAEARQAFETAMIVNRNVGQHRGLTTALSELAALDHEDGARPGALAEFAEAEASLRASDDHFQLCLLLASRSALEAAFDPARASSDLAEAEALFKLLGGGADSECAQRIAKAQAALAGS